MQDLSDSAFTQLRGNNVSRRLARPVTPVSAGVMDGSTLAPDFLGRFNWTNIYFSSRMPSGGRLRPPTHKHGASAKINAEGRRTETKTQTKRRMTAHGSAVIGPAPPPVLQSHYGATGECFGGRRTKKKEKEKNHYSGCSNLFLSALRTAAE